MRNEKKLLWNQAVKDFLLEEVILIADVLNDTTFDTLTAFLAEYTVPEEEISVAEYLSEKILQKGFRKKTVIGRSGVTESLGYKLLNGTKTTTDRDKIIGLCVGSELTVGETNHALTLARLGVLYPESGRDAVIIVGLRNGINNVMHLNEHLASWGFRALNLYEKT